MESADVREYLKPLIEKARKEIFLPESQAEQTEARILGCIIAKFFAYSGEDVLEVAVSGLEESNFHGEAEAVQELIDNPPLKCETCGSKFTDEEQRQEVAECFKCQFPKKGA